MKKDPKSGKLPLDLLLVLLLDDKIIVVFYFYINNNMSHKIRLFVRSKIVIKI